jgi:hypothetical protein
MRTRLRAVASENLTGMAGAADRSWMNALLVGYAPVNRATRSHRPGAMVCARLVLVPRGVWSSSDCAGLRLYEEHERLG